jgi:hypothetical protein
MAIVEVLSATKIVSILTKKIGQFSLVALSTSASNLKVEEVIVTIYVI